MIKSLRSLVAVLMQSVTKLVSVIGVTVVKACIITTEHDLMASLKC